MFATPETPATPLSSAQAIELCLLVEMEARWENLRKERAQTPLAQPRTIEDLHAAQKAFSVFRTKLAAYNKKHTPAHVTDLLLNHPNRLGPWCRRMAALYLQVEHDARVRCPVHLMEKAYRCADGIAARMGKELFKRSLPLDTTHTVIGEFAALAQWCENVAQITAKQAV